MNTPQTNDAVKDNKLKTAETVINVIAMLGIAPAFILMVVFFLPDSNLSLNDIIEPHVGSLLFAALFIFGAALCIYIANPHKLIFLLPLLCIAILPALSSGHKEESKAIIESGELDIRNGFDHYGGKYAKASFSCDQNGRVILSGLLRGGGSTDTKKPFATLPENCHPNQVLVFGVLAHHPKLGDTNMRVDISNNGELRLVTAPKPSWLSLGGISFWRNAEQVEIEK